MTPTEWAARWGVTGDALAELLHVLQHDAMTVATGGNSETAVQNQRRADAAKTGGILWRNNVGVLRNEAGVPVRYGLCNESKQQNQLVKSSDLIGITPLTITAAHVGHVVGVFTAEECKKPGWQYSGKGREVAQLKFHNIVESYGGIARFITA